MCSSGIKLLNGRMTNKDPFHFLHERASIIVLLWLGFKVSHISKWPHEGMDGEGGGGGGGGVQGCHGELALCTWLNQLYRKSR